MNRIVIILAAFVCMIALGASETKAGKNSALVGTWSGEFGGEPFQLILNADGTGEMDGPIRWTAQGNELRGTLTLMFNDGRREQIEYHTSVNPKDRSGYGPAVIFDGTNYQRTGDGNCG